MTMSKEALEAVEAIRRDLKIAVRVEPAHHIFSDSPSVMVTVDLMLGGEVISSDSDYVSLPRQD